jgi:hypothetical protein
VTMRIQERAWIGVVNRRIEGKFSDRRTAYSFCHD